MKKRVFTVVLAVVLVVTLLPVSAFAASGKGKNLKSSQYAKVIQGRLKKSQVERIIDAIVVFNSSSKSKPLTLNRKQIKANGYRNNVNRIATFAVKDYGAGSFSQSDPLSQWCESHKLKDANRVLSFYTDYRYKKNQSKRNDYDYLEWRSDSNKLYFYGGIGWVSRCKITSAKKYAKKIVLKVSQYGTNYGNQAFAKYTVTLKKQKNKKFVLYKIKETWHY